MNKLHVFLPKKGCHCSAYGSKCTVAAPASPVTVTLGDLGDGDLGELMILPTVASPNKFQKSRLRAERKS